MALGASSMWQCRPCFGIDDIVTTGLVLACHVMDRPLTCHVMLMASTGTGICVGGYGACMMGLVLAPAHQYWHTSTGTGTSDSCAETPRHNPNPEPSPNPKPKGGDQGAPGGLVQKGT